MDLVFDTGMELVFDQRSANSSFVEVVWHTHSERAGTFTSVAVSNWEMVITTFNGKTMITARGPETKASEADFPADAEFVGIIFTLGTFMPISVSKPSGIDRMRLFLMRRAIPSGCMGPRGNFRPLKTPTCSPTGLSVRGYSCAIRWSRRRCRDTRPTSRYVPYNTASCRQPD